MCYYLFLRTVSSIDGCSPETGASIIISTMTDREATRRQPPIKKYYLHIYMTNCRYCQLLACKKQPLVSTSLDSRHSGH